MTPNPKINGLSIHPDWVSPGWELWLLREIEKGPFAIGTHVDARVYPSRVARFGAACYGNAIYSDKLPRWTEVLKTLHPRVEFDHVTVNYYAIGDGIGAHVDRADAGETIAALSLGGAALMEWRLGEVFQLVSLPPRSLMTMSSDARWIWHHGILPVAEPRISVVMRKVRPDLGIQLPMGTKPPG